MNTPDELDAQFEDLKRMVDGWQKTINRLNQAMAVMAMITAIAVGGFIAMAGGMFR